MIQTWLFSAAFLGLAIVGKAFLGWKDQEVSAFLTISAVFLCGNIVIRALKATYEAGFELGRQSSSKKERE